MRLGMGGRPFAQAIKAIKDTRLKPLGIIHHS